MMEKGAAVFYRLSQDGQETYYVKATEGRSIHGFVSSVDAVRMFEDSYFKAIARGYGWSAGAMLNFMYLSPRVFDFTLDVLKTLMGETIYPVAINGTGVHEVAFKCKDQKLAAELYKQAVTPRLAPTA